ncbi:MAG: ethylbenzene dehydrogenase-related protein [Bacteroidia bacterium]
MRFYKNILTGSAIFALVILASCERDYFPAPPKPKTPQQTTMLEATYTTTAPTSVSAAVWKQLDYVKIPMADLSTGKLYDDGFLNMTGTYNGLTGFNNGLTKNIVMKAAYDDNSMYIMLEWEDYKLNASSGTYYYDGPEDPLKSESSKGWTSQKNTDQVALAFDINAAKGLGGTFTDLGCAASCHNGNKTLESGTMDIWNWNMALSEPLGFALDRNIDGSNGFIYDNGKKCFERNGSNNSRTEPLYEWNGEPQTTTKFGKTVLLDPGFFLVNKTAFKGDAAAGQVVYANSCTGCHGEHGDGAGEHGEAPSLLVTGKMNRFSREGFKEFAGSTNHTGFSYFQPLTEKQQDDLIARLHGFSGMPGYVLSQPDGSNADIIASSNVALTKLDDRTARTKYQVILIRKLNTGNNDDVAFNPASLTPYIFGVALMDNDGKNHIGSTKQSLIFKSKN